MDVQQIVAENEASLGIDHDPVSNPKRDWNSLPVELKRKVIKCLSIRTRFTLMMVSKSCNDIARHLNGQETKLVIVDLNNLVPSEDDANSLCGRASHTFDCSSVLHLVKHPNETEALELASNFPNLIALRMQIYLSNILNAFRFKCKLEHLSIMDGICREMNFLRIQLKTI